jgi:carbon-monoxide dehydrogenase medium subunit
MIAAAFEYHRPADLAAAFGLLADHGSAARVVAGGHSLIPMMKLRVTAIDHLVDLRDIAELRGVEIAGGRVRIGAMVTQHEIIGHEGLAAAAPVLREAALQIADPQVRTCGTIGGNLANGDPGNDLPAVMQCLNAAFTLAGPNGRRMVKARDFYRSAFVTERADDEILTEVSFTAAPGGYAYEKQKRKIGDYATAACAALVTRQGDRVGAAAIAMTNLADRPVWSAEAGAALVGTPGDAAAVGAATAAALAAIDPAEDNRGPVEFKRHVAGIIITRAIERALSRA